ncbi:MAG: hypothetical protein QM760_15695 [Nibricoccus sp.]
MRKILTLTLTAFVAVLSGCASYKTPGAKADLQALAPYEIQKGFATKPSNPFPAAIVAARVQANNYSNYALSRNGGKYGQGRFSVITVREVEEQSAIDRITKLPEVTGAIALNRMLIPETLNSYDDLRAGASQLHADLLLVYTFDTAFFDRDASKPLTVITLGLSPTRKIKATSTASALLIDTRTGFIYGTFEATEQRDVLSTSWGSNDSADEARKDAEKAAFNQLVGEFEKTWPSLVEKARSKSS